MRKVIIKIMQIFTSKKYQSLLDQNKELKEVIKTLEEERKHLFRKGDGVYINAGHTNPEIKYYLIEPFLSDAWIISRFKDADPSQLKRPYNRAYIKHMRHEQIIK